MLGTDQRVRIAVIIRLHADLQYKRARARAAAAKGEERARIEKQELEQAEKDGLKAERELLRGQGVKVE
jgi:hypothetical protein